MCLIVDANRAAAVFGSPGSTDAAPIWNWLLRKGGALVYGGRLKSELLLLVDARRCLVELRRAGRAFESDEDEVRKATAEVAARCTSNDPHVIGVARVSGARVLCSDDQKLIDDFKSPDLISRPRGKVYRKAAHARLLGHSRECPKRSRRRR